jgi:ABC-type arginine transport system ATPase subunit
VLARGNSARHQTVAKRRGYLFRRPGRGCHVARLLDEPTASLDPAATKAIEDVIRSVAAQKRAAQVDLRRGPFERPPFAGQLH